MKGTIRKIGCICVALLTLIATLITSTPTYAAEQADNSIALAEEVVYDSADALFAAMRKVFLNRQNGQYEFAMTESVLNEIGYYDELYHQWFLKKDAYGYVIFDFYGDQSRIPANEGDYLQQSYYGFTSMGYINDGLMTIEVNTSSTQYVTTLAQEAAFESKLKSLFAAGGPLAHVKGLSDAQKVDECMKYIRANVSGGTSYDAIRHTAYSALCEGTGTCQAFALLLNRMLREVGIPNRILMGVDAAAHTYNIVMLDGKYYYCDASANVLLKGSNNFKPAQLQEHYLTDDFRNGVLSKISATDYPYTQSGGGNTPSGGGNAGGNTQVPSHSHDFSKEYTSDENNHWYACNGGCGEVKDKEAHVAGEWVVDKAATTEEVGSQSKKCTKCGYVMETQEIAKLTEYKVLDGADSTYQPGVEEFALRAEGELEKFVDVEVDGKKVDPKYYTVRSGSTIITFTKEFMDMLSEGKHVVKFNFTDGFANANITVSATEDKPSDTTTDTTIDENEEDSTQELDKTPAKNGGTQIWLWILGAVIVVAGAAVAGVIWYRKTKGV